MYVCIGCIHALFPIFSKRHLSEADALLGSKKRKVEDHSGLSSSSRKSGRKCISSDCLGVS